MQKIGRFEILEELGRGSMGAVYKARDPQIGRVVAIKIILSAHLASEDLEQYRQRFQREAQAAGRLSHPGIVTIHDIAEDESGQPYLVMEFVEGTPLDKVLSQGQRLPLEQALETGIQVARALDYAHRRGVIHRDIKPANILLTAEGGAKIADFGIAKLAGTQMTQAGQVMGTPAFMSPEQFSGAAVDARSDLFSLGAVLYWMFTGQRPFAGDTFTSMSFKIVYAPHTPARQVQPGLPEALDTVLGRALAKNPADRYASCAELASDLEALRDGRPVAATPAPVTALEQTVVTSPAPVERTQAVEATLPVTPAPRFGRRLALQLAAGGASLAVLALGYWLWPESAAEPAAGTKPAAARPKPPSAPMATLRVICEHNFSSARLTISSGDTTLLQTTLRGQEQGLGAVKVYHGRATFARPIPAGRRNLRVSFSAPAHNYEETGEISGSFPEGGSRSLQIEFGRGSALGVIARKLRLSWQ
jgi:serine/threonine-protein kinase